MNTTSRTSLWRSFSEYSKEPPEQREAREEEDKPLNVQHSRHQPEVWVLRLCPALVQSERQRCLTQVSRVSEALQVVVAPHVQQSSRRQRLNCGGWGGGLS